MKLSARCLAVTGLGYLPPWTVNAGFIVGDETTLIVDTGANGLAAATIYGDASAVRPSNRIIVINTEKHFDHIGGNSWFIDRGYEVLGHAAIARTEEEFRGEAWELNAAIANSARRALREERVFFHGSWLASLDRIERLRPQTVMAGHGPVVTGNDVPRMIATVRAVLKQSIAGGQSPTASSRG